MAKPKTEFSVDQKVVYPSQGVGKVTEIFKKEFNGNEVYYYRIYVESSDTWVLVPFENASKVGIRAIVSAEEAQAALDSISKEFVPTTTDWKLRYQINLDLLRKGSIADIASIVRSLYHRSKIKELPILERKLYDSARKLLEDEIAEALGKSSKEIEIILHEKLEPLGVKSDKKPIFQDEDDFDDDLDENEKRAEDEDSDDEDDDSDEDSDDDDIDDE